MTQEKTEKVKAKPAKKTTRAKEPLKVGLLVGREWSWPPAFIEKINSLNAGVVAEFVTLGGSKMDEPCEYKVIIDRISHEVPYYRSYLKNAVGQGTIVINNPFWWTADDKFFGATNDFGPSSLLPVSNLITFSSPFSPPVAMKPCS